MLSKEKLNDFLGSFPDYEVWAPVRREDIVRLEVILDPRSVTLDLQRQPINSKVVIFPQSEVLFGFVKSSEPEVRDFHETRSRLVFGVRPCDAKALCLIDPVFQEDPADPYYSSRREGTVLIGIACKEPFVNCFCTSLGGSPCSEDGLDLLFTELSGSFHIKVLNEKGEGVVAKLQNLLLEATSKEEEEIGSLAKASERKIRRRIDVSGLPEKLAEAFEHSVWRKVAAKCLGCGICTYSCPTCICFDIQDEVVGDKGRRMRVWDSCMFPEYSLHASGHNPRPTGAERLRNRICHKFKYNVDKFGVPSCVGCGRCITLCPVNVDLLENLLAVKEAE